MKSQLNQRISSLAERQIAALQEKLGVSKTELITLAINQIYEKEIKMKKEVAQMTRHEILSALAEDGFDFDPSLAADVSRVIQHAARAGALLWSVDKVISTLHNEPMTLHKNHEPIFK